jgi:hypothetical protein
MRFKLEFTGSCGLCQLGGFLCRYGTDYDYHRCTFLRYQQGTEKGNPGSLERPQQIQAFKARAKLAVR